MAPPPPTLADPIRRPGVREVKEASQMQRPGIVQRDEIQLGKAPTASDAQPEAPKAVQAAPAVVPELKKPIFGGRETKVGDMVVYWQYDSLSRKTLRSSPAMLIWWDDIKKQWHTSIFHVGRMTGRHGIPYSDTPADCCWTWPEHKSEGDALATAESAFEMLEAQAQEISLLKATMEGFVSVTQVLHAEIEALKAPKTPRSRKPSDKADDKDAEGTNDANAGVPIVNA